MERVPSALILEFQSTLSVRRATTCLTKQGVEEDISIHALRKESDAAHPRRRTGHGISIHALRKESDAEYYGPLRCLRYFNPRSP